MCPRCRASAKHVIKKGFYPRKTGRRSKIQRFWCKKCDRYFSPQTGRLTFGERKAHLNQRVLRDLSSGVSQRQTAHNLAIHPRTVARKLKRLGEGARLENRRLSASCPRVDELIFDEMETFEHTKMKPLSIGVVVTKSRRIVAAEVAQMPAKGLLAAKSRKKYGYRADLRPQMLRNILKQANSAATHFAESKSDQNPRYPSAVSQYMPGATHTTFKGRRGCVVGQGELKAIGFDPLFSLNHSCAMYRDHLKTLTRRTWCTVKVPERLQDLIDLYTYSHNWNLSKPKKRARIRNIRIRNIRCS